MHHFFVWKWLLSMVLLSLFLQNYPAAAAGPQHIIFAAVEKNRWTGQFDQENPVRQRHHPMAYLRS